MLPVKPLPAGAFADSALGGDKTLLRAEHRRGLQPAAHSLQAASVAMTRCCCNVNRMEGVRASGAPGGRDAHTPGYQTPR